MSLRERITTSLLERRNKILKGEVNCIPLPFSRFRSEWCGVEQGRFYLVSGASKSSKTQLTNYIFVYNINSEDKNSKFTLNYLGDDSKIRLTPSVLE